MSEYWIVYDAATGDVCWRGTGTTPGSAAAQQPGDGLAVFAVSKAVFDSNPLDLDGVRAEQCAGIDAEAEATRGLFITPGSGQAMTYLRKEAEADAWLADNSASVPFLEAEAAATGVTVAALAALVSARAAQWATIGPKIEAARMGAKQAVQAAGNLAAIAAARAVDWAAVTEG